MNTNALTKTFNYLLITICLLAIIKSYQELYIKRIDLALSSSSPLIGEIAEYNNTVKVKKDFLFSWLDSDKQTKLNKNDLVYTHKNSTAKLKIGNFQEIEVFEQSMIEIEDNESIQINNGKLSLKFKDQKSKMAIRIGNKKYIVESKNAKVTIENNLKTNKIKINEGQVKITEPVFNKEIELTQDQSLDINQYQLKIQTETIKFLSPTEEILNTTTMQSQVNFEIESTINNNHSLEISSDRQFKEITAQYAINKNKILSLNPGEYFYRIKSDNLFTETKSLTILAELAAIKSQSPVENTLIQVYELPIKLDFNFTPIAGIENYILEITNIDTNEKNKYLINQPIHQAVVDQAAEYQWTIASDNPWIKHLNNAAKKFRVELLEFKPEKPLVIELKRPNQKVTFEWANQGKSTFILSKDDKFKDIIIEKNTLENKIDFTFPETGTFFWKNIQKDKKGNIKVSKPVQVLIRPTPEPEKPKELPELEIKLKSSFHQTWKFFRKIMNELFINTAYSEDKTPVAELKWPAIEEAKVYEIEVYEDESLNKLILKFISKDNIHKWKTNLSGTFYWRMRYQDYWNRFSPYSNPSPLKILPSEIAQKKKNNENKKNQEKISPPVIESNKIVAPQIPRAKKFLISYIPTLFTINSTYVENKFTIDGVAFNSWQIDRRHQLLESNSFFRLSFSQGTIFNSENFIFAKIDNPIDWNWLTNKLNSKINFYWSPQIHILQEYEYQSQVQVNQYATPLSLMAGAKYDWQKSHLALSSEFSIGQIMKLSLTLTYEYITNFDFSYLFGISMQNMTYNSSDYEHEINQFQLFISRPI